MRRTVIARAPGLGLLITRSCLSLPSGDLAGQFRLDIFRRARGQPSLSAVVSLTADGSWLEVDCEPSSDTDAADAMRSFLLGVFDVTLSDHFSDDTMTTLGLPWIAPYDPRPLETVFKASTSAGDLLTAHDAVSDIFDQALVGSTMRDDDDLAFDDEGRFVWNLLHADAFTSARTAGGHLDLTWPVEDPVFRVVRRKPPLVEIGSGERLADALATAGLVIFDPWPENWQTYRERALADGPVVEAVDDLEMYRLLGTPVPYRLPCDQFDDFVSRVRGEG